MSRPRIDGDSHSGQSTDEAFLSKGSSQEELDNNNRKDFGDSDEYVEHKFKLLLLFVVLS